MPRQSECLTREYRVAAIEIRPNYLEGIVREVGSSPQEAEYRNRRIRQADRELPSGGVIDHAEVSHAKRIQLGLQLGGESNRIVHAWSEGDGPFLLEEIGEKNAVCRVCSFYHRRSGRRSESGCYRSARQSHEESPHSEPAGR